MNLKLKAAILTPVFAAAIIGGFVFAVYMSILDILGYRK